MAAVTNDDKVISWPFRGEIAADPAGHGDQFGGSTARTQVVEAQFTQTFLVATALVHGKVGIAEVDGLGDASVLALSDRIAGVAREGRPRRLLSIAVRRTDGRSVTDRSHRPHWIPAKAAERCAVRGQVP